MSARRRTAFWNWVEYLALAALVATLRFTPRWLAESLGRGFASLLERLAPRLRRTALRNLGLALPELSPEERNRISDGVFRPVACLLVGASRLPPIV